VRYEPPGIEQRADIGGPLIGIPSPSVPFSPTWRRPKETS
jgi:hypothetical protein